MVYYLNPVNAGLKRVQSLGDGYSIKLEWYSAYPSNRSNSIAYHIYVDTEPFVFETDYFNKTPSFISIGTATTATILDLTPGYLYHFAVRAVEYNSTFFDLQNLPQTFNGLRFYPESLLAANILENDLIVPLIDADLFPISGGTVKIGGELINYSYVSGNNLVLISSAQRGYSDTTVAIHNIDGYDGYTYWDPKVVFWPVFDEDQNTVVYESQNRFDSGNYSFTIADGYHQKTKDLLNTDLSASDTSNADFPSYDYSGWHRTDPVALLNGECVGSYIGGEYYCADGYDGVGRILRGMNLQDINTQRQEQLLDLTGEPVVLIKRVWTGITCDCYIPGREYPENRCIKCYGTGMVVGYQQYFNPRRSDSRIMMRFEPAEDQVKTTENGMESEFNARSWTLVIPAIKSRDIIVRFDEIDNDEFRYEVISVNRNKLLNSYSGSQKLTLQRIRKTDPAYQIKVFRNTAMFPNTITTGSGSAIPGIPPHTHTIVVNEKNPITFAQITSQDQGHSHVVSRDPISGILRVEPELGHTHALII